MRLEKYIVPTIFPDHLQDVTRMISHETMKNALHPKNHHGFKHAQRTTDSRLLPIGVSLTGSRPVSYQTEYSARRGSTDRQASRLKIEWPKYKKYKEFKITTKAVEHRGYAD